MSKLYRSLLWTAGLVVVAAACGDEVVIQPPPPPPPPPEQAVRAVSVTPDGASISAGATQQFSAAVTYDPGPATPTVAWTTTAAAAVGSISATGLFTSVATAPTTSVGVTATATLGTSVASGGATLNVVAAAVCTIQDVEVNPSQANIVLGESFTPAATVSGTNCVGAQLDVTWSLASPAGIVTVNQITGEITGVGAGTAVVRATSTVDPTQTATVSVTVRIPEPATVSIEDVNYVPPPCPAPPPGGPCGVPSIPVNLNNVFGQIEIIANVNAGEFQLARLDAKIGGQVVASQTFPGTSAPVDPEAGPQAQSVSITLSVNTRQLRDAAGGLKVPVIFNGNQFVALDLYVVDQPIPLASNATPIVMNNLDAFFVVPGVDGPSLTRTADVAPAPVMVGAVEWWKGSQTVFGTFIAYSNTTPSAFGFSASTVCGGAGATTITGTPTGGLTMTAVFGCAGVEGQNFLGAAPAGVLSYAPAVTGPDGTLLATPGTLGYTNVGSAFQLPTGPISAPALEDRYNPIALAVNPSGFIDNEGPSVDIASSTTLLFAAGPPAPGGRAIAFNPVFDQWWIGAGFVFADCSPSGSKTPDPAGVYTPGCGLSGYRDAADGGVGLAGGFPISRLVVSGGGIDACTGADVASGADLAETVTSADPDGYRLCVYAEDLLANASGTGLGISSAAQPSNTMNKSNRFGVDKVAPTIRFLGSTAAAPAPVIAASTVSGTANTTIYSIAAPRPVEAFGVEAQDTRSGFHQGAPLAGFPAAQTLTQTNGPTGSPVLQPCAPIPGSLATLLSDTWVRSVETLIDCGLVGAAGVSYWAYNGFVTDRSGNESSKIALNYAADDVAGPNITGLGFAAALYMPGVPADFGFSANDDLELIDATVGVVQYMNNGGLAAGVLRYPLGSLTPLGLRFDVDCTVLQPNCVFTNVLNGAVASIPSFIFRVDEACTAAATPYASCTAVGTIATPPAGVPPAPPAAAPYYLAPVAKTLADYNTAPHPLTDAGYLPTAVSANVGDVASQLAAAPIIAPMLGTQFSPAAGIVAPWAAADILSWSASIVAASAVAIHVASTSIQVELFNTVELWRLDDIDVSGTLTAGDEWVHCGTFPAGIMTDNGSNRFWTYTLALPTTGPCILAGFAPWRAGGTVGGAMIMTPDF